MTNRNGSYSFHVSGKVGKEKYNRDLQIFMIFEADDPDHISLDKLRCSWYCKQGSRTIDQGGEDVSIWYDAEDDKKLAKKIAVTAYKSFNLDVVRESRRKLNLH